MKKKVNNKLIKYNLIMIIWGLITGPLELLILSFTIKIDIPFIKVPFYATSLILAILAICIRLITHIIQIPIKNKIKDKSEIKSNRNLALYFSLISIIISFFTFWCIGLRK